MYMYILVFIFAFLFLFSQIRIKVEKKQELDFNGKFKPKMHFFFEKCSKCGKRLKHYHWFWGKGDYMGCDVDYFGNTEWYCEECDKELHKNVLHKIPTNEGGAE